MMYYIVSVLFFLFVWCPCMALMWVYSITVGFSPILYCWPYATTNGELDQMSSRGVVFAVYEPT